VTRESPPIDPDLDRAACGDSPANDRADQLTADSDRDQADNEMGDFDDPVKRARQHLTVRDAKDPGDQAPSGCERDEATRRRVPPRDPGQHPQGYDETDAEPDSVPARVDIDRS
jgi:hypothetical protein